MPSSTCRQSCSDPRAWVSPASAPAARHDLRLRGGVLDYADRPLEERNGIARAMFRAWWYPFSHYGVIHGDPHLGNYTVFEDEAGKAAGVDLLDYGCIPSSLPKIRAGVH